MNIPIIGLVIIILYIIYYKLLPRIQKNKELKQKKEYKPIISLIELTPSDKQTIDNCLKQLDDYGEDLMLNDYYSHSILIEYIKSKGFVGEIVAVLEGKVCISLAKTQLYMERREQNR